MKWLLILSLFFVSCKGPKTISKSYEKDIQLTQREIEIEIAGLSLVDTTDLSMLQRGEEVHKTDTETGIKTSYRIKDNSLITSIDVPKRTQKVIVHDTKTTITIKEVVEKRKGFWERVKEKFNSLLLVIIVLLITLFLIRKYL